MTRTTTSLARRPGFTLVELLVVVTIIIILAGLLTAAVFPVLKNREIVITANDINQLSNALEAFKTKYGLKRYPPARILLKERVRAFDPGNPATMPALGGYDVTNPFQRESLEFIREVWPRITGTVIGAASTSNPPIVNWSGKTALTASMNGSWTLEGDQVLVFFLGGIPVAGAGTGFSTNPIDPSYHVGRPNFPEVVQPFFEFKADRLGARHGTSPFWSYRDGYNREVYAYLSSYKAGNDYTFFGPTDCPTLNVAPYREPTATGAPVRFYKREGFQIISAGRDGVFGPGGVWTPAMGDTMPAAGRDDQSNFHPGLLGSGR
jgi:prepilin-type N-terminal cleavage/methylation domain-containing protein